MTKTTKRRRVVRRFRYPGEPRTKVVKFWQLLGNERTKRVRLTYLPRQRDEGQRNVIVEIPLCENLVMALEIMSDNDPLHAGWPAEHLKYLITNLAEAVHKDPAMCDEYYKRLQARYKREGRPYQGASREG